MEFKVGDKVRPLPGYCTTILMGEVKTITSIEDPFIRFDNKPSGWSKYGFELVAAATPAGSSPWQVSSVPGPTLPISPIILDFVPEETVASTEGAKRGVGVCDCGGLKTFGTLAPEAHSHWCSSRSTGGQS